MRYRGRTIRPNIWGTALLIALVLRCSSNVAGTGNSSDTGNVAVVVVDGTLTGKVSAPCFVAVFAEDYVPIRQFRSGFSDSTWSDTGGVFRFERLQDGWYNLLVECRDSGTALLAQKIPVFSGDTFNKVYGPLAEPGAVEGIAVSKSDSSTLAWTYIYLPGTPYYDYTGSSGEFMLTPVPPGAYRLTFWGLPAYLCPGPECVAAEMAAEADTVIVTAGTVTRFTRTP